MTQAIRGLILSQFLGVFCEYACKLMVFTLATRPLWSHSDPQSVATLSLLAFLVPKMLFSIPAGLIADRFDKKSVMVTTKSIEILVFLLGACSLFFANETVSVPFFMLALLGMQSALFNPAKSGILPELICATKLPKGNSLLEMWGMVAIFFGTVVGPLLLFADQGGTLPHLSWTAPLLLAFFSLLGLICTLSIPKGKGVATLLRPSLLGGWREIFQKRSLLKLVFGMALYWIFMSFFGQTILVHAKKVMMSEAYQGIPLGIYWLGIAIGCAASGRVQNTIWACTTACLVLLFAVMVLTLIKPAIILSLVLLTLIGIASGFILVPFQAYLQKYSSDEWRGSVIASSNILNIKGILIGSFCSLLFC